MGLCSGARRRTQHRADRAAGEATPTNFGSSVPTDVRPTSASAIPIFPSHQIRQSPTGPEWLHEDLLAGDGEDLRSLPLGIRKVGPAQLLSREVDGIFIAEYEQGDIADVLFRVAFNMQLERIVSKHLDRPYGEGRSRHWI
jgi:hypothetical protein